MFFLSDVLSLLLFRTQLIFSYTASSAYFPFAVVPRVSLTPASHSLVFISFSVFGTHYRHNINILLSTTSPQRGPLRFLLSFPIPLPPSDLTPQKSRHSEHQVSQIAHLQLMRHPQSSSADTRQIASVSSRASAHTSRYSNYIPSYTLITTNLFSPSIAAPFISARHPDIL